jgi:hypothetical protein
MTQPPTTTPAAAKAGLIAQPGEPGIDPRGPRFGAGITAVLLLVVIALGLGGSPVPASTVAERAGEPAFVLFAIVTALFAWGAFAGVQRHPYGQLFARVIRPRLGAPTHRENPKPPTFAQGIGFVVTAVGIVLQLLGVPFGLVIPAAIAFVAAFLNSVFDYCFGCQIYLLLVRAGIVGRRATPTV